MRFPSVLGVGLAALAPFVIGALWYSPLLFQRQWMAANGFTSLEQTRSSQVRIFSLTLLFATIIAFNLAMFLNAPDMTIARATLAGALTGVWVALAIATTALFERRPLAYIAVNSGYWMVSLSLMGAILGAMTSAAN